MLWSVQKCCEMYRNVVRSSEMLWNVQKWCENVQKCCDMFKMLWDVHKCSEMYINVVKCSDMLWNVQKHFEMLKKWKKNMNKKNKSVKNMLSESLRTFGSIYEHSGSFYVEFGTRGLVEICIFFLCVLWKHKWRVLVLTTSHRTMSNANLKYIELILRTASGLHSSWQTGKIKMRGTVTIIAPHSGSSHRMVVTKVAKMITSLLLHRRSE